ncbi:MAG: Asp23/Gls24 family envelope stress response protein [Chloroflexi bacterium]|nr:MAG: Asp23/Gls24 family envelope stress response protein [Chloroflexota bacterium]
MAEETVWVEKGKTKKRTDWDSTLDIQLKSAYLCSKIVRNTLIGGWYHTYMLMKHNSRRKETVLDSQQLGTVRVAKQVLSTIVINSALQISGIARIANTSHDHGQWTRLLGREIPRQGVALTIKDNTVSADLYIVVNAGIDIVEVGSAVQEEVASALAEMVGMQVGEVNVYIQDVA